MAQTVDDDWDAYYQAHKRDHAVDDQTQTQTVVNDWDAYYQANKRDHVNDDTDGM